MAFKLDAFKPKFGRRETATDTAPRAPRGGLPLVGRLPALLRREADVRVDVRRLEVRLHVTLAGGLAGTDAVARAPLP